MRFIFGIFILWVCVAGCSESTNSKAIQLNQAGLVYQHSMLFDSAIVQFKKALSVGTLTKEVQSTILRNLAICFVEKENTDSAKFYYRKAANVNRSGSYKYLVNMADVHIIDKDFEAAISNLEQAFEIDPDKLEVNNTLGLLYLGEYDSGFYDPQKALRYNMKANDINLDRSTQFVLGKNYFQLERYPEAIAIFSALYNNYPNHTDYLYSLILIHDAAGNKEESENLLKQLQSVDVEKYEEYRSIKN